MSDTQALTRTDRNEISHRGDGAVMRPSIEGVENALLQGDLSRLSPQERLSYYEKVCESVGLNPLTRPFEYIKLNGKLTLYAKKDATEQLRKINGVSITKMETDTMKGIYVVRAHAVDADGRTDVATGAVPTKGASGDRLANALMKAETKAKRRVTLSICGLGWLDETELETIPSAQAVEVNHETGEVHEPVDYEKRVRTAKNWLAAKPDDALVDAFEQVRAKAADWPEEYRARVEDVIAKRKEACSQLPDDTPTPNDKPAEDANDEPAEEHPDYNARIDRLRAELRAAYGDEDAWNTVIEKWIGITAEWPKKQKQRANRAVVETKEACEKAAEEAKAEQATKATDAMQRGETALPKKEQSSEPAPLPEDVPMRQALIDAGLTTRADVQRLYAEGELQDVKGIGPKTESQIVKTLGLDDDVSIPTDDGSDLFG